MEVLLDIIGWHHVCMQSLLWTGDHKLVSNLCSGMGTCIARNSGGENQSRPSERLTGQSVPDLALSGCLHN